MRYDISLILKDLRQINEFGLNDLTLQWWAVSIIRIIPDITEEKVRIIIDKMLIGNHRYIPEMGIQNFFQCYQRLYKL